MLKCKECGKDLGHFNEYGVRVFDVGVVHVGVFCTEHGEIVENESKQKRFVEEYKGNKIYMKNGQYYPYWECQYSFDNLKNVKIRIDNSHTAVINKDAFKFINS